MSFEPQRLFVGLVEFFTILLPGAFLTFLLLVEAGPHILAPHALGLEDAAGCAAFLFTSYLLGHLVSLLGSFADHGYDRLRRRTLEAQIARVACRGAPSPWPVRLLALAVFGHDRNRAVERAGPVKAQLLGTLRAQDAINTFRWSQQPVEEVIRAAARPSRPIFSLRDPRRITRFALGFAPRSRPRWRRLAFEALLRRAVRIWCRTTSGADLRRLRKIECATSRRDRRQRFAPRRLMQAARSHQLCVARPCRFASCAPRTQYLASSSTCRVPP